MINLKYFLNKNLPYLPYKKTQQLFSSLRNSEHKQQEKNIQVKTIKSEVEYIRLSKYMAQLGICSRREADQYIKQDLVKVNGIIINELGYKLKITELDKIKLTLDEKYNKLQDRKVTIMVNKPYDYVSNLPEHGNKSALSLLSFENQFKKEEKGLKQYQNEIQSEIAPKYFHGLAPCGRLDLHSQGLMIYTQDGRVAKSIINNNDVEKEYIVRVNEKVPFKILKTLREGKIIVNGTPVKKAFVERVNNEQLRFVLTEGRKRQIRHMCEFVGLKVSGLKRVRIGNLMLGNLPEGNWRYLTDQEIQQILGQKIKK